MFAIVGLGNPGEQYIRNRHNIGFQCVAFLAKRHGLEFNENKHHARIANGTMMGHRVILARPTTFMNASGEAVGPLVRWHKIDPERELLVVYDDMDLPFGTLRMRASGSAGGQNGMKSIIQHLGTDGFPRLRIGIGRPQPGRDPRNYVLDNWNKDEADQLPQLLTRAADAVELWLTEGILRAMNRYNTPESPPREVGHTAPQAGVPDDRGSS